MANGKLSKTQLAVLARLRGGDCLKSRFAYAVHSRWLFNDGMVVSASTISAMQKRNLIAVNYQPGELNPNNQVGFAVLVEGGA